eukprot:TRINITY_DN1731_c0_g2_i1.p1 TRINITY_DN1731_c0_g2~~TRINITY_DN1731_c0_g2_i1.p1  ORF type:complete len:336 (-),score=195.87 TRINITY_DN1731_c0_g2_i1:30-992(-)
MSSEAALASAKKGELLFADVFRRADKNDDGKIDMPEFEEFFGDDRVTKEQLETLFKTADTDGNGNIDTQELVSFFKGGVGEHYAPLFASLEAAHAELSAAMRASHAEHAKATEPRHEVLFKERFYLRELTAQFESLARTTEASLAGVTALSERAADADSRNRFELADDQVPSLAPSHASPDAAALAAQVDKLAAFVARLEKSEPRIAVREEQVIVQADADGDALYVLSRSFRGGAAEPLALAARAYVAAARNSAASRHVGVRIVQGDADADNALFVHETWESADEQADFVAANKSLLDAVAAAATESSVEQIHLPATWFL